MYVTRALEPIVRKYSDTFKVVVVTGSRQVGKTTMLKHLMDEDAANGIDRNYVSLDNTTLRIIAKEDPALFLQRYKPPILIDEIQYAPELLPHIKMQVDNSEERGSFWLTGSQPFHLMKNVSESLAGRAGIIEMLGFSNTELQGLKSESFELDEMYFNRRVKVAKKQDIHQVFGQIAKGAFPEISIMSDDMRANGFESFIDTYLMRDVRDLAQVGDELRFRKFMTACASLTARPLVYAELARLSDINEKTAKAWLSIMVSSYLIKVVRPYSNNILKRLSKQPVMHFLDTGLCAHLCGWENAKVLEMGAMSGQIFESYVFSEIYKSFINSGQRPLLYFFRSNDKKEIDILLEKNGILHPIEIKKTATPTTNDIKNFSALEPISAGNLSDEFKSQKREIGTGCVVCMTDNVYPISKQAWAMPIWAI